MGLVHWGPVLMKRERTEGVGRGKLREIVCERETLTVIGPGTRVIVLMTQRRWWLVKDKETDNASSMFANDWRISKGITTLISPLVTTVNKSFQKLNISLSFVTHTILSVCLRGFNDCTEDVDEENLFLQHEFFFFNRK